MTDAAWYDLSQHDLSSEKSWENKSEFLEANAEKTSVKGRARKMHAFKNGFSLLLLFIFYLKKKSWLMETWQVVNFQMRSWIWRLFSSDQAKEKKKEKKEDIALALFVREH